MHICGCLQCVCSMVGVPSCYYHLRLSPGACSPDYVPIIHCSQSQALGVITMDDLAPWDLLSFSTAKYCMLDVGILWPCIVMDPVGYVCGYIYRLLVA